MNPLTDENADMEPRRSRRERDTVPFTPRKKKKAVDDGFYKVMQQDLKNLRPRTLTVEEKIDIVAVQAKIRHGFYSVHQIAYPGRKPKTCHAKKKKNCEVDMSFKQALW